MDLVAFWLSFFRSRPDFPSDLHVVVLVKEIRQLAPIDRRWDDGGGGSGRRDGGMTGGGAVKGGMMIGGGGSNRTAMASEGVMAAAA